MNARLYILLNIKEGKAEEAISILRNEQGVVMADAIESSHDIILVMEGCGRQHLAELTVQALTAVKELTEETQLLPAKELTFSRSINLPLVFNPN